MIFVFAGTFLIAANHLIRYIIKKKKNTYEVKPYDKKLGLISTLAIVAIGGALTAVGASLMTSSDFVTVVEYNKFNVGLIVLVLSASVLLTLIISIPILLESFKKQPEVVNE